MSHPKRSEVFYSVTVKHNRPEQLTHSRNGEWHHQRPADVCRILSEVLRSDYTSGITIEREKIVVKGLHPSTD